jgi:hypothetical protein
MKKFLAATAAVVSLVAAPVLAAPAPASEPVKLSDTQLDEVTAGDSLLDLFVPITVSLNNISVSLDINNVPVNVGAAVQLNALGTAAQTASVTAFQSVTQLSQ